MNTLELEESFKSTIERRYKSWGRLISVLKRQFNAWISEILEKNGYEDFKMAYMPLLMNIGPDGITNKELAEKAFITKQAMSKVVKELLEKKYIETEQDFEDKRCANIFLTAKGKKLTITVCEKIFQLEAEYNDKFGVERMEETKELLLEMIDFNNDRFFSSEE